MIHTTTMKNNAATQVSDNSQSVRKGVIHKLRQVPREEGGSRYRDDASCRGGKSGKGLHDVTHICGKAWSGSRG